jgi:5-methylcytosine-specific restriction endonuclease McrA
MGFTALVVVIAAVALVLLLRGPVTELRKRRRERAQERKRAWRRQREIEREQRRTERAMNPAKAAAKKGPPRWQQVVERQGSKCWLCGTRTFPDDRRRIDVGEERLGATYPTVDYLVPIDRGGTYELDNVRLAHRHCRDLRTANPARQEFGPPKRTFPA